jgi:hypothetical protein
MTSGSGAEIKMLIDQKLSRARHIVSKWIPYETRKRSTLPKPVVSLNRSVASARSTTAGIGKNRVFDSVLVGHKMRKALLSQTRQSERDEKIADKRKAQTDQPSSDDEGLCKWKLNPNKR